MNDSTHERFISCKRKRNNNNKIEWNGGRGGSIEHDDFVVLIE